MSAQNDLGSSLNVFCTWDASSSPSRGVCLPLLFDLPCVLAASPDLGSLLVDDVDWDADDDGKRKQYPRRVSDTQLVVHWARIEGAETCQDISRESITTSGGGGVLASVCGDHVVDRCKINGQVCGADDDCHDQRSDPW
jgi:hypothetical protein